MKAKNKFSEEDIKYMKIALKEAKKSSKEGNLPVGAVLVINGKYIGKARNKLNTNTDWASHAELKLMHKYSKLIKEHRKGKIADVELYTTLEPCFMCFGTSVVHRITRIIYACPDPYGGTTDLKPKYFKEWYKKYWPKIDGGLLKEESCDLIIKGMKNSKVINWQKAMPKYEKMKKKWKN